MLDVAADGAAVSVATTMPSARNSTRAIEPSISQALADIATKAGAVKVAPADGAVRATPGAWLPGSSRPIGGRLIRSANGA